MTAGNNDFSFTVHNDSLYKIINRMYGSGYSTRTINALAKKIILANDANIDLRNPFFGLRSYALNIALHKALRPNAMYHLPSKTAALTQKIINHPTHITKIINAMGTANTRKLADYSNSGHSFRHLVAHHKLKEKMEDLAVAAPIATADRTADYVKDAARELHESFEKLNNILTVYAKHEHKADRKFLAKKFTERYQATIEKHSKQVSFIANQDQKPTGAKILQPKAILRSARRNDNFDLLEMDDVRIIARNIDTMRYVGRGLIALDVGIGAFKVYEAYKHHENWHEEMVKETGSFIGGALGGAMVATFAEAGLIGLGLTPVGWAVILIGTTGALLGSCAIKYLSDTAYQHGVFHYIKKILCPDITDVNRNPDLYHEVL